MLDQEPYIAVAGVPKGIYVQGSWLITCPGCNTELVYTDTHYIQSIGLCEKCSGEFI